jgi:GTPase SAR1 family protein
LWDTAGQERFYSLMDGFWRSAQAVVIVFALNDRKSFEEVKTHWVPKADDRRDDAWHLSMLIGNKRDVPESERAVTEEEARLYASRNGMKYVETSALDSDDGNVEAMFERCIRDVLRSIHARHRTHMAEEAQVKNVNLAQPPAQDPLRQLTYAERSRGIKRDTCGC